tara:strand:- start:54 stop:722 length:669 start_codon:yes stop_codon:yes gene_type:complete
MELSGKKIIKNPFKLLIIYVLKVYRYIISPILGVNCRFVPTCSEYSIQAFNEFGFFKGFILTIKRLAKCHPLCKSEYDPIEKNYKITIKKVSKKNIRKFRIESLYSNMDSKLAFYKDDMLKSTLHLALFLNDKFVSGLTLIKNENSFQIRGMFTVKDQINKGFGSELIRHVKKNILDKKNNHLWCNARIKAINFYKKNNFKEDGDIFLVEKIGLHKKLEFHL